ncbi:MAG: hypothetical protein L3K14_08835 [Thermoplasmata archaeon]|nr:hypothetical protein [Thermoplasmata archaeon]
MGGLGSLSSSRLTKLLQEKAELLKKKRERAEALLTEIDARIQLLDTVDITIPDLASRIPPLRELQRKADWEALESQSKSVLNLLEEEARGPVAERQVELTRRADRLAVLGNPLPAEARPLLDEAESKLQEGLWREAFERLAAIDEALVGLEKAYESSLSDRVQAFVRWAGGGDSLTEALEAEIRPLLAELKGANPEAAQRLLAEILLRDFPNAAERRSGVRGDAERAIPAARELGAPTGGLETALEADKRSFLLDWPQSVASVEQANDSLQSLLRERVASMISALHDTLEALRAQGVDPNEALASLEQIRAQLNTAKSYDLPGLSSTARESAEGPVVAVVAGVLDEVRPRLVEARRLGRDPSDVFAAMNRAREALRLRIYGEAIAASQEALERVTLLLEDIEGVRSEAESVREMLVGLAKSGFASTTFEAEVARSLRLLEQGDLPGARRILAGTVSGVGRDAVAHFQDRLVGASQCLAIARERGFLPSNLETAEGDVRTALEAGRLTDVGAELGRLDADLRTAAAPYMARRLEEMEKGLAEIPEEQLVTPVRSSMADADVNLRVKENLLAALESLRRAEREFSSVFAARASSLVEALAVERRVLEEMGGTGDEIQREIDEVEQIFNMGDFVKASKAAQEIRTRTLQQQLIRSEESVSHAKLALVELETMGLDVAALRTDLEHAQESAKNARHAEAYRLAEATAQAGRKLKVEAQEVLDLLSVTSEQHQALTKLGQSHGNYRTSVQEAKQAYQSLDFAQARAVLAQLQEELQSAGVRTEASRLLAELKLVAEDGRRLSVPIDATLERLREVEKGLSEGRLRDSAEAIRAVHGELVSLVRPVLEENLRALEGDADTARGLGLDVAPVAATLSEARRRLSQPVPTGVAPLIESARSQFFESRGFLEHSDRVLRRATDALNQAELVRVDVAQPRERLRKVQEMIAHREYPHAIEQASSLERELNQATFQQVSRSLAGFQGLVTRARHEGADTTLAENFLQQARAALENSQPIEALQLAARAESEIERVELQAAIARGSLETMETKLGAAEKEGVVAPAASEELGRARTAFARHDYVEVLEMTLATSDSLAIAREYHRRATEAIDVAQRQRDEAESLSAEFEEASTTLTSARELAAAGQYVDAIRRAREASEKARWATERLFSGGLEEARRLLELAQRWVPERVTDIAKAVDDAETALKARDWNHVTVRLRRAQELADLALAATLDARQEALRALYDRILSGDAAEKERRAEVLRDLAERRSRREYPQAFEAAQEEESRLSTSRVADLRRRTKDLEESLLVGEKLGLDTTPVMQLFSEAKLALQAGKSDPVSGLIDKATTLLGGIVKPRVGDKLRDVRAEFVFARDGLNVNLASVGEILDGIPRLVERGELVDAARMLLSAEEQINQRKAQQRELTNLHYLIDAALTQARARGVDTTKAQELLAASIQARSTDYGLALEKARQAHETLKVALKSKESPSTFWPFRRGPGSGT